MKKRLVVFSVLRNAIQNGYPFVETYSSWFDHADEVFVLDGMSTDGTDVVLRQLASLNPKLRYERAPWPTASLAGSAIAEFTNEALSRVRDHAERVLYVQADEIFEVGDRERLAAIENGAARIDRYVLFWNSFYTVLRLERDDARVRSTRWHAIRSFPSTAAATSFWRSTLPSRRGVAVVPADVEVLHYGWNFPVNILQKHVSHGRLYRDDWSYVRRARAAAVMLRERRFDAASLMALDEQYLPAARPFRGTHPLCVRHLVGMESYDPYVGLGLLAAGVRW